jgi:phage FluMu protein Com
VTPGHDTLDKRKIKDVDFFAGDTRCLQCGCLILRQVVPSSFLYTGSIVSKKTGNRINIYCVSCNKVLSRSDLQQPIALN